MEEADNNKDGVITLAEFKRTMFELYNRLGN